MKQLTFTEDQNYVAFFLTFACNLKCPYCINLEQGVNRYSMPKSAMSGNDWVAAANRLELRPDLPLTLQGGEPTLHKDFYQIVNEVKPEIKMDLLTNMQFDAHEFVKNVPLERFTREAPYASIRVSYHPGQNNLKDVTAKTRILQDAGFRVGIYSVDTGNEALRYDQTYLVHEGFDFRFKELLGFYNGKMHGTFKYADAMDSQNKTCQCRTSELLVGPDGNVYRCHSDLYNFRHSFSVASILDPNFTTDELYKFRRCVFYGTCNPCDIKIKTNRFQVYGHTSVEIKDFE